MTYVVEHATTGQLSLQMSSKNIGSVRFFGIYISATIQVFFKVVLTKLGALYFALENICRSHDNTIFTQMYTPHYSSLYIRLHSVGGGNSCRSLEVRRFPGDKAHLRRRRGLGYDQARIYPHTSAIRSVHYHESVSSPTDMTSFISRSKTVFESLKFPHIANNMAPARTRLSYSQPFV